jgi:hypothetical protein
MGFDVLITSSYRYMVKAGSHLLVLMSLRIKFIVLTKVESDLGWITNTLILLNLLYISSTLVLLLVSDLIAMD